MLSYFKNKNITLYNDNWENILPEFKDNSIDSVIIDPPYGMGLDTWDVKQDIPRLVKEVKRIGKDFFTFFGQMPYCLDWLNECKKQGLHYLEHISWVKRSSVPTCRLQRSFENIFIYSINKQKKFYNVKGLYSDVSVPGLMFDIVSISRIKRYIV